jgi:O-methyltransferase involved in polyketide biosynthesis
MNELLADDPKLIAVRITGLITVICHAIEGRSEKPLLRDPRAEAIADQLAPQLANTPGRILRCLTQGEKFAGRDLMALNAAAVRQVPNCSGTGYRLQRRNPSLRCSRSTTRL